MLSKKTTSKSLISEMDQRVKHMLKLIEEDGDSFSKKAEMYYQKRPELIRLVEDFHRRYCSLAERYDNVAGDLRKAIPSDLQSQGSGISDFGSEPPSVMPSPDQRLTRRKSGHRAPGFDFFLGGNGEEYESTLDSESDSDEFYGKIEEVGLRRRVLELEAELRDVKEKLHEDNKMVKYEGEIKCLKMELERDTDDVLSGSVINTDDPVVLDSVGEVFNSSTRIQMLEEELRIAQEKVSESKREVASLKYELTSKELYRQNLQLQDELRWVKDGRAEVEELKQKYASLQEKYDALIIEMHDLACDASFKDDQIDQMSNHLNQLHMEHFALIDGAETAHRRVEELKERVKELEREVEKKQEIIALGAEEKREAIRQLCNSLEHYRNGYHRLREVVTGPKAVEASQVVI